jgi:hypothetical protein
MVLDDRHILFLRHVFREVIRLKKGTFLGARKYVSTDKTPVDQTVAAQMHILGATRLVSRGSKVVVVLTNKGQEILLEEDEAWG